MSLTGAQMDLTVAINALRSSLRGRKRLDSQIDKLSARIKKLCARTGTPLPPELQRNPAGRAGSGLTASIREVFGGDPWTLTAVQVHDLLVDTGRLDVSKYRNSRSVIHNTLRRMVKQGELSIARTIPKTAYKKSG